jgi:hypothetical protein
MLLRRAIADHVSRIQQDVSLRLGRIANPGARFENQVAMHLYKAVQKWTALVDVRAELFYIRDKRSARWTL